MTICPECDSESVIKNGKSINGQKYKCKDCGNNFIDTPTDIEKVKVEDENVKKEIQKTKTENKVQKEKSQKPKQVWFRAHYKDLFDEPKESKKYGFKFNSWFEYFVNKYEYKKAIKAEQKLQNQHDKAKKTVTNEAPKA